MKGGCMNKTIVFFTAICLIFTIGLLSYPASASFDNITEGGVRIVVDGWDYSGRVLLYGNTAYVSLREFATMADNSVVSWNKDTHTARVITDSLELSATEADRYITANGRVLWCDLGIFTKGGMIYVPLRQIAGAFGFDHDYVNTEKTTYLTRLKSSITHADLFYDASELYWLSKIINAEAGGEPFLGKLAVGTVILNRVDSDEFPDTIYDVIFDTENGVQFSPTSNGAINNPANEDSVIAAKLTLENTRLSEDILYFLNERLATNFWIVENCRYVMSIGCHDFYAP
jgi:N-acetylmuramoyl-L-alanine amidase